MTIICTSRATNNGMPLGKHNEGGLKTALVMFSAYRPVSERVLIGKPGIILKTIISCRIP